MFECKEVDMKRIIFHVDVNSAFLSWEACYRIHHLGGKQDLREMVSAVGGDQEKRHGIILAKSILAKMVNPIASFPGQKCYRIHRRDCRFCKRKMS